MPAGRLFVNDEELGKKDDEYRPGSNGKLPGSGLTWAHWNTVTPRIRRRRLLAGLGVIVFLIVFIKNIPTDLTPVGYRLDRRVPGQTVKGYPLSAGYAHTYGESAPTGAPPKDEAVASARKLGQNYYNGPIRWFSLATSLQETARKMGYQMMNKNVAFAAAGQQSVARLIPVACEMGRWSRNAVHLILLGRDDLTIDEYKEINGVDKSCQIFWHDARPDYAPYSTDERFEMNTYQSLVHIHNFLRSQVLIMDDPREEEAPFVKGLQDHAEKYGKTVIYLPTDAVQKAIWLTRLDSGSLAAWHNTYVEILIHAPPESSGSFIRLLRSIRDADYFGTRYPHLTIELPAQLDPTTEDFLENFIWPPPSKEGGPHTSQLTLRRRIPSSRLSATEASIRMIESFYPSRIKHSHVLLLSHQVELSPLYYHYLMFNILEYKYSNYAEGTRESESLMGISLNLPERRLDDKTILSPPPAVYDEISREEFGDYTPFLWQAPDAHATLYFGDKWREFHSFLSSRFKKTTNVLEKSISATFPAFAEHLLEIMRARNYFILYPHIPDHAIATVHNELYIAPEEFSPKEDDADAALPPTPDSKQPYLTPVSPKAPPQNHEKKLAFAALHKLLPSEGDLPELSTVPLLSWDGELVKLSAATKAAKSYTHDFRIMLGQCPQGYNPQPKENSADDLFCYDDIPYIDELDENGTPVGFGSNRGRIGYDPEFEPPPRDENGLPLDQGLPEKEQKQMSAEFEKHLARQGKQEEGKSNSKDEKKKADDSRDERTNAPTDKKADTPSDKKSDISMDKEANVPKDMKANKDSKSGPPTIPDLPQADKKLDTATNDEPALKDEPVQETTPGTHKKHEKLSGLEKITKYLEEQKAKEGSRGDAAGAKFPGDDAPSI